MKKQSTKESVFDLRTFLGNVTKYVKVYFVVKPLQFLFSPERYEEKLKSMRSLPQGTVGHDLAKLLDRKQLKLIPGFGKHDLNHLILRYDMAPEEELCMQAYLLGNGHWQLQCFLFLSSAILLPGLWSTLWQHYDLGRRTQSISSLKLDDCLHHNTEEVRRRFTAPRTQLLAC